MIQIIQKKITEQFNDQKCWKQLNCQIFDSFSNNGVALVIL